MTNLKTAWHLLVGKISIDVAGENLKVSLLKALYLEPRELMSHVGIKICTPVYTRPNIDLISNFSHTLYASLYDLV